MRRATKVSLIAIPVVVFIVASPLLVYLPSSVKVTISGIEVKRKGADDPEAGKQVRDVRYILAKDHQTGKALVFRNEDTGWGWPPYFKFDAADLSSAAADLANNKRDAVVLLTYYGVRSPMLDLFPNAVSLEVVEAGYTHVPWFNIVFSLLLCVALIYFFIRFRRLRRRIAAWRERRSQSK